MSRPRQHPDRVSTAIRLPADLHRRLTAAAEERMVATNLLVTRAIEDYLDRLIPVDEAVATRTRPQRRVKDQPQA